KPDTVPRGEHTQWLSILRGKAHKLSHGYFVTKQPSQEQLDSGISHAEARRLEAEFFRTTEPWATELRDLSHRFGTVHLTQYLSQQLAQQIHQRLPDIVRRIQTEHEAVTSELDQLQPAPHGDNNNQFFVIQ